jgi:TRAP-type C4-dicarboxylate transport system substrate-binding protein
MATNSGLVYHKKIFEIWGFAELPFIGPADWLPHSLACEELYYTVPELKKEADKTGLKLITMVGVHPTHFMSKKPIRKLEDFKGLRIRALGGMADFVNAAGAAAVPITAWETYEALQKGTVDASQAYMYGNIPYKFHEVTKYAILPGMQNITVSVWMNKKVFNK